MLITKAPVLGVPSYVCTIKDPQNPILITKAPFFKGLGCQVSDGRVYLRSLGVGLWGFILCLA